MSAGRRGSVLILALIQGSRMTKALPTSTCDFHTVASKVTLGVDIQQADGERQCAGRQGLFYMSQA